MRRIIVAALLTLAATLPARAEAIKGAVSAADESSHVFCDATGTSPVHKAPCQIRSLYVTVATAVSGFVMAFDAVSAPADGAVTPRECVYLSGPGSMSMDFGGTSEPYVTGLTVVFSSTGCFTKTASATAFFKGRAQ